MNATPATLDHRRVTIECETFKIATDMVMADIYAKEYCQHGVFIPASVIEAHAREVATNAYDAAHERERAEQMKTRARQEAE